MDSPDVITINLSSSATKLHYINLFAGRIWYLKQNKKTHTHVRPLLFANETLIFSQAVCKSRTRKNVTDSTV